jgi:hypothetical protein
MPAVLKQNLQEEQLLPIVLWMDNIPVILDQLWPKIQSAATISKQ